MEIPESTLGDNRRKCVRIRVPDDLSTAVLTDGAVSVKLICTDQSAEGFGARCEQEVPWAVGQTLLLNTDGNWHEVKLARCCEQEPFSRIGLQRIRDCDDDRSSEPFRFWVAIRNILIPRFARDLRVLSILQILGIFAAFLLCTVVLTIVLLSKGPLNADGRWLGSLSSSETDESSSASRQPRSTPISHPASEMKGAGSVTNSASDQRIKGMLSGKKNITWSDVEAALGLTKDQSRKLLALLRDGSSDQVDTTTIVIDSRQDFVAFLETLPEQSFFFLSDEQQLHLQAMLRELSQP